MFEDTYISNEDGTLRRLGKLYAELLQAFLNAQQALAAVKQTNGERVERRHPQHARRELIWERASLRLSLAIRALHPLLQPVWDEAQSVRRKSLISATMDGGAVRKNNVIAAEELYNAGCALYWDYRILRFGSMHFHVQEAFRLQEADPNLFLYEHGDATLDDLTAKFKVLHDLHMRAGALFEAVKRAKSNRVERSEANLQLHLERERRYEASLIAHRQCLLGIHPLLRPLWEAAHQIRCRQDVAAFVTDEIAIQRLCVAAAETLHKTSHAAFYEALAADAETAATDVLYQQEPRDPRVFLMMDEVELGNPLPPAPYQTRSEAKRAGDLWAGQGGYCRDVIVDTREYKASAK